MFGSRRRPPRASAFPHSDDCKMKDLVPEWMTEPFSGRWERRCTCNVQYAYDEGDQMDPNSPAAEPAPTAHKHAPSCGGAALPQVVKVERRTDGGWSSRCLLCDTLCIFWWDPDRRDQLDRPVEREGYIAYRYPLAHETVGV